MPQCRPPACTWPMPLYLQSNVSRHSTAQHISAQRAARPRNSNTSTRAAVRLLIDLSVLYCRCGCCCFCSLETPLITRAAHQAASLALLAANHFQLTIVVKVQEPKHPLCCRQLCHIHTHLCLQPSCHVWPHHARLIRLTGADSVHLPGCLGVGVCSADQQLRC